MEVMASLSHDSLGSSHIEPNMQTTDITMTTIQPDSSASLQIAQNNMIAETVRSEEVMGQDDGGNPSIGCQTALSYAKQDTLVPLTALLQLVNNSILTVMENIEKVLLVNTSEEGIFSADSINSFWNAATSSVTNSPTSSVPPDRVSPSAFQDPRESEPLSANSPSTQTSDKLVRPIVIQDIFRNNVDMPSPSDLNPSSPTTAVMGAGSAVMGSGIMGSGGAVLGCCSERKYCGSDTHEVQGQTFTTNSSTIANMQDDIPPTVPSSHPTSTPSAPDSSSSPGANPGLTKYICPYCYKVFNWKTNMNRHISVTHLMKPKPTIKVPIMRKSKPYTCPICGNTFAWRSNMNRHILHLHKIDHKQLNKLLLSAYLPDIRTSDSATSPVTTVAPPLSSANQAVTAANTTTTPNCTADPESFSSLGALTMLPQNSFKTVNPSTPPPSSTAAAAGTHPTPISSSTLPSSSSGACSFSASSTTSPEQLAYLYRHHKALLESVKKEQVPVHVKEAALASFYQNNKSLFDHPAPSPQLFSPTGGNPMGVGGLLTPPKSADHKLSPPITSINNLSVLYQKALMDQRNAVVGGGNVQPPSAPQSPATSAPDMSHLQYQSHRAMLDTVNLLSNLNTIGVSNKSAPEVEIKMESTDK